MKLKKLFGRGLRVLALMVLLLAGYLGAALLGACIPRNAGFRDTPQGIPVAVYASEIHCDVIVPAKNEVFDWTALLPYSDVSEADERFGWLAFGWGDRRFYLETPTWADVKVRNVIGAFCGIDATAMHIHWLTDCPPEGSACRVHRVNADQYLRLCRFISDRFQKDARRRVIHIAAPGYGPHDAFYEANGRYSFIQTCNSWTGQALGEGGLRVGAWTPMKWGVFWQL